MVVEGYNAMSRYGPWKCPRTTTAANFFFGRLRRPFSLRAGDSLVLSIHENSSDLGHFIFTIWAATYQYVRRLATHDLGPSRGLTTPTDMLPCTGGHL